MEWAVIILAAGFSSRAQSFKPLLPLGDSCVIAKTADTFRQAGIRDITAVVGHRADELIPVLNSLGMKHVVNCNYSDGMFSSVFTGVQALSPQAEAFFLIPADIPLVKSHSVRLLGRAFKKTGASVVYPSFQGTRGHPPLISACLKPAILEWSGAGGLCALLEQHESRAYEVEVLDEGISMDIDTPADYEALCLRCQQRYLPTSHEAEEILAKRRAPDTLVRHGRCVSHVAGQFACQLNWKGFDLDANLVRAAGLLHDIAKGKPNHSRTGARVLKSMGYGKLANIVASHHDPTLQAEFPLDETMLVYLADKLVQGDCIVSLEERFRRARQRYASDPLAAAAIDAHQAKAQRISEKLERVLGKELSQIVKF